MPLRVETHAFEPGLLHDFHDSGAYTVGAAVSAFRPAEHEWIFRVVGADQCAASVLLLAVVFERVKGGRRNRETSAASPTWSTSRGARPSFVRGTS
jgi:hypothetical protein